LDFSLIKKRLLISIALGLTVLIIMGIYSDFNRIAVSIREFNLRYLPLILMLAPLNYFFRFIKWSYYLKLLKIDIGTGDNIRIFTAGLGMTVTPGKVGEFLKAYLIKEFKGIPASVTSPLIVIERLTDGISMIILAGIGTLRFKYGLGTMLGAILLATLFIAFIKVKPFALWVIGLLKQVPLLGRAGQQIDAFYQSTYQLLGIKPLVFSVLIGMVSWAFEGVVIFFAMRAFNHPISILSSIFVVAFSSIAGALSMLPGGLVVAEGSIIGLLILMGVPKEIASGATIITWFSTLWLGVLIGAAGLVAVQKKLNSRENSSGKQY